MSLASQSLVARSFFILGASDPEMEEIERIIRDRGLPFVYATVLGARRVRPEEAYRAYRVDIPPRKVVVLVECQPELPSGVPRLVIDHHRPDDPGYGLGPEAYMDASSLGQVLSLLDEDPTPRQRLIAAADHCLGAAYRGLCPGVDPAQLMEFRAESRAKFQGRSVQAVIADIKSATKALLAAPTVYIGDGQVARDMRGKHVSELPEAAARVGECFISDSKVSDGRTKLVCQSGSPEQIAAFMQRFAAGAGLKDVYGDPARGFAGGFLPA
jgi:hypothetical protein